MSKTINFSNNDLLPSEYYTLYKIVEGDTWTNIAYKHYRNIKLWWLICKFNNIKNPFT
jgi:nucleoid-associated protein YgaU